MIRGILRRAHPGGSMFCSRCGASLLPGQAFCSQCGQPVLPAVPPVPNLGFQVENYRGKIRVLGIVWFIYAAISLLTGFAGLTFLKLFFAGHFGPWMYGSAPPAWIFPIILRFAWVALLVRSGLAVAAGVGLLKYSHWGRVVAIIAAFFCILKFPLGMAMGIWTLVVLLGYRNATLYRHL